MVIKAEPKSEWSIKIKQHTHSGVITEWKHVRKDTYTENATLPESDNQINKTNCHN